MPHARDPERHYIASANNRIAGRESKHFLGHDYMNGFRARRIVELLEEKERLSPDDFQRMHVDVYCRPAKSFCALLAQLRAAIEKEPALATVRADAERALDLLASWDHVLAADSLAGALYELMRYFSTRRLFEPHLGDLVDTYLGVGLHPVLNPILMGTMDRAPLVAEEILVENDAAWLRESRESLLARALYDSIHYLRTTLGPDASTWRWGAIHFAGFHHPMGSQKPLDRIFNRGPFPQGGDTNTVWQAAFVPKLPIAPEGGFTASWRQIFDVGNWDDSRGVHTTGQSGHPASPHYDDQIRLWLDGKYHPMPWSRSRVEEQVAARLLLEPR
jgi:penicillin amidase